MLPSLKVLSAFDTVFTGGHRGIASELGVTVIVPLYNYEKYVINTLNTVVKQYHRDLSIIVVNDGSTDNGEGKVKAWMKENHRRFRVCKLLRNQSNYGLATSRNIAFSEADSEYIFVLDADNEIYPSAIEKLVRVCDRTGAGAAYSQLEIFDEEKDVGYAYAWSKEAFKEGNYVDAMALLRRSAWSKLGGYDLFEIAGWEDFDMWCKFHDAGIEAVFVPQILCRYRVHGTSMLRSETNQDAALVTAEIVARHPWLTLTLNSATREDTSLG